jgi:hypothetical protein
VLELALQSKPKPLSQEQVVADAPKQDDKDEYEKPGFSTH